MFDIGFIEMLVVGLILLLVVGPERLPEVARTVGGWVHEAKRYLDGMKSELDRDLHFSELQRETRESFEQTRRSVGDLDPDARESAGPSEEYRSGFSRDVEPDRSEDPISGHGEGSAGVEAGDTTSEEEPSAEEQAAEDMERELKRDQTEEDKDRG